MLSWQTVFPLGWGHYLAGGLLIGTGVAGLFVVTGLVGGMSSVFSSTWSFVSRWPISINRASCRVAVGGWSMRSAWCWGRLYGGG